MPIVLNARPASSKPAKPCDKAIAPCTLKIACSTSLLSEPNNAIAPVAALKPLATEPTAFVVAKNTPSPLNACIVSAASSILSLNSAARLAASTVCFEVSPNSSDSL